MHWEEGEGTALCCRILVPWRTVGGNTDSWPRLGEKVHLSNAEGPEEVGELLSVEGGLAQAQAQLLQEGARHGLPHLQEGDVRPQDVADVLQRQLLRDQATSLVTGLSTRND